MRAEEPNVALSGRYTPSAAARILGVDRSTLYRAMSSGELAFILTKKSQRRISGLSIRKYYYSH